MVSDEFSLIEKIKQKIGTPKEGVILGIGDDAAVLAPSTLTSVVTVDAMVEGVHFDLKYFTPEEVGHKALAMNLSDIAAMGGAPKYALISLGVRHGLDDAFILRFYDGLLALAKLNKVQVVGGNITRSKEFFASVTVMGESSRPLTRSGAKPGDLVGVTGNLGNAAFGLKCLLAGVDSPLGVYQKMPMPRIGEGKLFSRSPYVTSCIDISDGLSSELHHLSECSKVAIEIEASKVPLSQELNVATTEALQYALHGGEDYELLVTFEPSGERSLASLVTVIGRVVGPGTGVSLLDSGKSVALSSKGWHHF